MSVEPTARQPAPLLRSPGSPADTMLANDADTIAVASPDGQAAAGGRHATRPATSRMGSVLPDVQTKGETLVLVPRDATRYQHDQLLGRGGMGEVQLATDHDIGRQVAVKRVLEPDNAHAVARFIDEVRVVGSLEHPNIVPIHDVGVDDDGALFFVMKYVEGDTLSDVIAKLAADDQAYHRRFSFEHRLDLFAGLLRALQYAHSRGLVHRDIKPDNIMVGAYGEVMLMDWGIAHPIEGDRRVRLATTPTPRVAQATIDGTVVGTPQYMSPEQAAGEVEALDGRSDLYSAFTVLWELLTLTPYVTQAATPMLTVLAAQERVPPRASDPAYDRPGQVSVGAEWRHFLHHGLAQSKDERFTDAAACLAEFDQVRAGDFAVQCPVTFMKRSNTRLSRLMDRRPMLSIILGVGTATAAVLGIAGWVMLALGA